MKSNSQSTQNWWKKWKKKVNLKKEQKNDLSQPGLTFQTHDLDHETGITLKKVNKKKKKLESTRINLLRLQPVSLDWDNPINKLNKFSINSLLNDEIEKKNQSKKEHN